MKQYNILDLSKFIMSIGIVMLHISPINPSFATTNTIIGFITSLCVPLFFVFSSFLFFSKKQDNKNDIFHFIKRIGVLYVFWLISFILIEGFLGGDLFVKELSL